MLKSLYVFGTDTISPQNCDLQLAGSVGPTDVEGALLS